MKRKLDDGDAAGHSRNHAHDHDHAHDHGHAHSHEHEHPHGADHTHAPDAAHHSHPDANHPDPTCSPPAREPLPRGAGRGRVLYLDAGSGLAGDMIVAALLDLGLPESELQTALAGLDVRGYRLQVQGVLRSSIAARRFVVHVDAPQPPRDYATIVGLIESADSLSDGARKLALRAFEILARAEAQVHDCPIESVHFHEVGAVDSIVDIVAAAVGFDYLGADVVCSPLPLGRGSIRSAHGTIPLPAPATVLCLTDVPTYDAGIAAELVTPTGACLVASVAREFGAWPAFRPERVGLGAGTKQLPDRPNLLRMVLGRPNDDTRSQGRHVLIEANIDDMSPELAAFALQRTLELGALDAWSTPIGMKKGRAALKLSVLCARDRLEPLARVLLSETTTLGVRHYPVDRIERPRRIVQVETAYGSIDVKVADGDGLDEQVAPEYETCKRAAQAHEVPIRKVYAAALAAFEAQRR
jgi:uncharacterized protein (TIGR00299 family) protein